MSSPRLLQEPSPSPGHGCKPLILCLPSPCSPSTQWQGGEGASKAFLVQSAWTRPCVGTCMDQGPPPEGLERHKRGGFQSRGAPGCHSPGNGVIGLQLRFPSLA